MEDNIYEEMGLSYCHEYPETHYDIDDLINDLKDVTRNRKLLNWIKNKTNILDYITKKAFAVKVKHKRNEFSKKEEEIILDKVFFANSQDEVYKQLQNVDCVNGIVFGDCFIGDKVVSIEEIE